MASKLSQRVCIKPGAVKQITSMKGRHMRFIDIRTKKALCGKLEHAGAAAVFVRVRGQLYAVPARRLREYKQMWSFRP